MQAEKDTERETEGEGARGSEEERMREEERGGEMDRPKPHLVSWFASGIFSLPEQRLSAQLCLPSP